MKHKFLFVLIFLLLCIIASGCEDKKQALPETSSYATIEESIVSTEVSVIIEEMIEPTQETTEATLETIAVQEPTITSATFPEETSQGQTNKKEPEEAIVPETQSYTTEAPTTEPAFLENIGEVEEGTGWG